MTEEERNGSHETSMILTWNINLLCLIGASIGMVAVLVAWISEPLSIPSPPSIRWEPSIVYMVTNHYLYYGTSAAFLVGTIAAFVSPLGGILQSASLVAFAMGIIESGGDPWLDGIDPQQTLRVGMYLGIVSCTLVMTSLLTPIGTGSLSPGKARRIRLMERLLVITPPVVGNRP